MIERKCSFPWRVFSSGPTEGATAQPPTPTAQAHKHIPECLSEDRSLPCLPRGMRTVTITWSTSHN